MLYWVFGGLTLRVYSGPDLGLGVRWWYSLVWSDAKGWVEGSGLQCLFQLGSGCEPTGLHGWADGSRFQWVDEAMRYPVAARRQ